MIEYITSADVPESVRKTMDETAVEIFRKNYNASRYVGDSELDSSIQAYAVLEKFGYAYDDESSFWMSKNSPTVADVHVNRPLGGKKPKEKDDPGGEDVDANPETDELETPEQYDARTKRVEKRISGSSSVGLNAKGKKLAERLGDRIAFLGGLDVLHTSPLRRARQTADAIVSAAPENSIHEAAPNSALQPWHLGDVEGKQVGDVENLIAHYVENPEEVPPGKGADGKPGETFDAAKARQLKALRTIYADAEASPEVKIGVVMHSRGMQLLEGWVDAGSPDDFAVDAKDLLEPNDPDHASVLRWHNEKIKPVDLDEDAPLKPGVILILHSLTDDDTDEGNAELEKIAAVFSDEKKFVPPDEVRKKAHEAWTSGLAVSVTRSLVDGKVGYATLELIAKHFEDPASLKETRTEGLAWGGKTAAKWARKLLAKRDGEVAKAGNGVMLAFWPPIETAKQIALPGGEAPEDLHVTLGYFGQLADVDISRLADVEANLKAFAANHGPLPVALSGWGLFPATEHSDGKDVVYLRVDSEEIVDFRNALLDAVECPGFYAKRNFEYTPHMTMKLVDPGSEGELPDREPEPIRFDRIGFSIGSARMDFALGAPPVADAVAKAYEIEIDVRKFDEFKQQVFGWFSIIRIDGKEVIDTQGDIIDPVVLEDSVYAFNLDYRAGGDMHQKKNGDEIARVGRLIESCMFTPEKQRAMQQSLVDQRITATIDIPAVCWWGGFQIDNASTWNDIVSGKLRAFSIGGTGKRDGPL